jgi:hypothetical protein
MTADPYITAYGLQNVYNEDVVDERFGTQLDLRRAYVRVRSGPGPIRVARGHRLAYGLRAYARGGPKNPRG